MQELLGRGYPERWEFGESGGGLWFKDEPGTGSCGGLEGGRRVCQGGGGGAG